MAKEDLIKNFPEKEDIPEEFFKLYDFYKELGTCIGSDFEFKESDTSASLAWFDDDDKASKEFVIFGSDGPGSLYGFWMYDGKGIKDAPIVYLGSEGSDNTVLANNIKEFIQLLSLGVDGVGLIDYWEEKSNLSGLKELHKFMKDELGIEPITIEEAKKIFNNAKKAHPDLDKWVEDWSKEHFKT